jgi:hypothetical protein
VYCPDSYWREKTLEEPPSWVVSHSLLSGVAEKKYIVVLLKHQRFDGFFHFTTRAEADATLGVDITSALHGLMGDTVVADAVINTAAVAVLLERDFACCKALSELMRDKAVAYLQKHGHAGYNTAEMAERLNDLEITISKVLASSFNSPESLPPGAYSRNPPSHRVMVERAPDDEDDEGNPGE